MCAYLHPVLPRPPQLSSLPSHQPLLLPIHHQFNGTDPKLKLQFSFGGLVFVFGLQRTWLNKRPRLVCLLSRGGSSLGPIAEHPSSSKLPPPSNQNFFSLSVDQGSDNYTLDPPPSLLLVDYRPFIHRSLVYSLYLRSAFAASPCVDFDSPYPLLHPMSLSFESPSTSLCLLRFSQP